MRLLRNMLLGLLFVSGAVAALIWLDSRGVPESDVSVASARVNAAALAQRAQSLAAARPPGDAAVDAAAAAAGSKQILFGDLHVHTTYSMDAFVWSIPLMHGTGARPPADACDFARFCSGLDFYALTDHAESLTPRHWRMIKDSVRACNAVAGPAASPDLVAFLGWEWTQMGNTPESHYGHRNVILRDTADADVPARPVVAGGVAFRAMRADPQPVLQKYLGPYYADFPNRQFQFDQRHKRSELIDVPECARGVPTRELPLDCIEVADTPRELFDKLDQWGFPAMVIPHGTVWGYYTPPGSHWDKQVTRAQHDPERQRLIEIYSGHGNAEEFRDWRAVAYDAAGAMVCPAQTDDYLPCCARAGQIIRERCDDPAAPDCAARVAAAERNYLAAGRAGHLTLAGVQPQDWLACGQCTDCFMPAFNYRAGSSVQAIMAKSNFAEREADGDPLRMRFGFIASSDNHSAQPGTGYKEYGRLLHTEARGAANDIVQREFVEAAKRRDGANESAPFELEGSPFSFLQVNETERQASFFYTGGLVAAHAPGRDRQSLWDALQRREVYGTSGPRLLLWFDHVDAAGALQPMGSIIATAPDALPKFRVRALGDFEQRPGCPQWSIDAVGAERLERLCGGDCYQPGDTRIPIERIEIVRIRRQAAPDEETGTLVDDPWRVFRCADAGQGCSVEFDDAEYAGLARDVLYYARAVQAPTPAVNGAQLRCEYDAQGRCVAVKPCFADSRTPQADECLAPVAERAWSSPIFLEPAAPPSLPAAAPGG